MNECGGDMNGAGVARGGEDDGMRFTALCWM